MVFHQLNSGRIPISRRLSSYAYDTVAVETPISTAMAEGDFIVTGVSLGV